MLVSDRRKDHNRKQRTCSIYTSVLGHRHCGENPRGAVGKSGDGTDMVRGGKVRVDSPADEAEIQTANRKPNIPQTPAAVL